MSDEKNLKRTEESQEGDFLENVIGFFIVIGIIFGFKYGKATLFPDKKALFFEEVYQWEQNNKDKAFPTLLSEEPITKGEFQAYEIAIRKDFNLKAQFKQKYSESLQDCINNVLEMPTNLKFKARFCHEVILNARQGIVDLFQKRYSSLRPLDNEGFLIKKLMEYEKTDLKYFDQLLSVMQILATRFYKIENGQIFFYKQEDLDSFSRSVAALEEIEGVVETQEKERLDFVKKESQQVKVDAGDAALATAIMFLGRRAR